MKALNPFLIIILFVTALIMGCEKEFTPIVDNTEDVVVEGFIEAGRDATPIFVILTRSIPFFTNFKGFDNAFVKGAEVWISNSKDSVRLTQFCWADLDPVTRKQAAQAFNINLDSVTKDFNFCVYIDLASRLKGEAGKTYSLRVKTQEGKLITAQTTIPRTVKIGLGEFIKPPGTNNNDTMVQLRATLFDPKGVDFYRYFTQVNNGGYVAGRNSVTDDAFFDGISTKFNLLKAEPRGSGSPNETFGLFKRGDTVSIKFCTIDKTHFDFWSTLEANANSGGPFSTYTKVKFNINGGLGIWGGYNASYLDTIVPKK
jgi:hypothetical protein